MEIFHFYTTEVSPYMNVNPRNPFGNNRIDDAAPQIFNLEFLTREAARTTTISDNSGPSHGIPHDYIEQLHTLIEGSSITMQKDDLLRESEVYNRDNSLPTDRNSTPSPLSIFLSGLGVPINFQEGCINKIHNMAVSMLQNHTYSNLQILMMKVTITCVKHYVERPGTEIINTEIYFQEDINDEFLMETEAENRHHHQQELDYDHTTCRATESSIEALEKVSVSITRLMNGECVICLENFGNGMEVRKLPCSHIYHGGCIKIWLARSIFCPICRFRMPCVHDAN